MKKCKYIFVVVTYKNGEDLLQFSNSLKQKIDDYKIIVVNSFYDDESRRKIEKISKEIGADFINTNNLGYGHGNNIGINYADNNYLYDYIIICNSDIEIINFSDINLPKYNTIIGPKIITKNGKMQNPYWTRYSSLLTYIMYVGRKRKSRILMWINIAVHKFYREFFLLFNKNKCKKTYALHGSFVLLTRDVVDKLNPIYDENMFLYNEEAYLAYRCQKAKINVLYYPEINILHMEDGSTGGVLKNIDEISSKSFIYYYEKCIKKYK